MYPFTKSQYEKLIESGLKFTNHNDFPPVCKVSLKGTDYQWLLNGLDPDEPDIAFGISDLAIGHPELIYISITDIKNLEDEHHKLVCECIETDLPISFYACAASWFGRIETSEQVVRDLNPQLKYNPKREF